ncbi:UDP-N-acetylmuramoyl-L-alanyl-D-glutamate--2,6-diaminopimelate ligase [Calidifontibacillus erzurumensis]|uniref:UDP-N-acetylmuramoyl-L-alanyl-D-glutamate--2,6-diaminopimelate ligase n=1 Tax=Calidifontibacillus erzurumensis TaxID=2741433 RepID=A0A8J8GFC0_9BACI|nr:UDP-N-acetylmuramoyl-L-alanyl-D-glutamate--2,6-diaminopimelate ligase [Calidifontibacillus erzurumensis]NSL50776.1 UDP-N-acetylmuramoyl-L-alanyl-D-glutamate--2,6-diaminopimelate ligase [Calidifontibacillus erzurumensis]
MELKNLLACLPHFQQIHNGNPQITSIEMDSRQVVKGSLFVCIKGYTVDGHDFVSQAIKNGASAIIAEKKIDNIDPAIPYIIVSDTKRVLAQLADYFYGQPTKKLRLIGVTGTNGKTTTTHIIEEIFKTNGEKTGLIGTMYIKIGDQKYDVKNTTPESLVLQKTFHEMVQNHVSTAIMEVSSHALDMGRVRGCDYDIAVFTNLTQDHLDYHQTMEEYAKAKGLLFAQLGNSIDYQKPKFAILNNDDPASEMYKKITAGAHILTYGIDKDSDVRATNIKMDKQGTSFTLTTPIGEENVSIKLLGKFSVYNVLAAVTTAIAANIPLKVIIETVEKIKGVAGRFELVNEGQDFTVIVDYSHTPDSLENALTTVKQFAKGKVYVVVGCGGDRDRTKRPIMAKIAANYSDLAIFTSDNPRTEDPVQILKDMEAGVAGEKDNYIIFVDRKDAISYAVKNAQKDDVILIAGKGHETYQIIGKEMFDFDDREVARNAIKERGR